MRATDSLLVVTHPDCALHRPPPGHPERPTRLEAAVVGAALPGARPRAVEVDERAALEALGRVHAPGLAARLESACLAAPAVFDCEDNVIGRDTYRAALGAVAASVAAAEAAAEGARRVWVPVRPPGHHALSDRAMGYCYFNNAAILAESLLVRGIGPIALVDFDVHHGNGTQAHFWERNDVFFLSVHRYPFYPGTGAGDEVGGGQGWGFTRNFPLAGGTGDDVYAEAVAAGVEEATAACTPAAWVVSAGFDAHRDDPLGGMQVTEEGFRRIGRTLGEASGERPVVAVLEGGYHLEALRRSVRSFLEGLVGAARP